MLNLCGVDLNAYRKPQLLRRLRSLLERKRADSLYGLARLLEEPDELEEFKVFLTINVSEFFRNQQWFAQLEQEVLPQLPAGPLRVWSAGCANGAEAYTLAMVLRRQRPGIRHYILGTDVDGPSLTRARAAVYTATDVKAVPEDILRREFIIEGDRYCLRPEIRLMVHFARHDLLRDPYPRGLDLIACRNVVIYFTDEAREQVYTRLRQSLRAGGFLFVGGTETVLSPRRFGFEQYRPFFYRAV